MADVEARIGIDLPADYREFLLRYNGGYFTEPKINAPAEGCPRDRLCSMRGIGAPRKFSEFASPGDLALFDDNDPPQILPIGYTLMGNLIFIVTHPEDNGCIGLKKASSQDCFFLARGIEGFFGLLAECTDD